MDATNLPAATWRGPWVVLAIIGVSLALATGCGGHPPEQPPAITVVATATSAEPRVALPDSVRQDIATMAKASKKPGGAMVRLVTSATGPPIERDVTPIRSNGQVQYATGDADRQIRDAVDQLANQLADAAANQPGLGLLPLLDRASHITGSDIHVISSGISTTNPMSFVTLGWDFTPERVVGSIERQGLLPDLTGHRVTFHGLGVTAGTQPPLPPFARDKVEQLWITLCNRAHATSCATAHESFNTTPPIATMPVPVVPIPSVVTEGGCPVWMSLPDGRLSFAANSSQLGPEADAVLQRIVETLRTCNLAVDISGNVADTGNGDPDDLSGQRARAVANRLVALGLSPQQLGTVIGRGVANPVVPNLINGQFDEAKAQLNRRTELTFHR